LAFVQKEGAKVPVRQRYLGSTDVLESLFGKYKDLPSARELVRENKRNSQDRVDAFPVDGALGWRLRLPD